MCGHSIYIGTTAKTLQCGSWKFNGSGTWESALPKPQPPQPRKTSLQHYAELTKIKVNRNG